MDECLEVLDCEKAVPYDEILVANVKLQVISEEAHKYMVTEAMGGNSGEAPTFLYRKSLINRLNKLREELASVISANCTLDPLSPSSWTLKLTLKSSTTSFPSRR